MIESLYAKYFQKSKTFLFPALGIKKTASIQPLNTYLSIEGLYGPEDMKLMVTYAEDSSEGFLSFEEKMLLSNPLFSEKRQGPNGPVYVFDFIMYKRDWFDFLMGHYSTFSTPLKRAIRTYFGENSGEYAYVETYLFPDKHFETYAQLLNVDISLLRTVGELCDPCDLEKENLKLSVELLENSEKVL